MIWLPDLATEDFSAIRAQHSPLVVELVRIDWPAPDGTIWYCSTQADEVFRAYPLPANVGPIEVRFENDVFLNLSIEDGISDSSIDLVFWDADKAIRTLQRTHGFGQKIEVFYWFPEHGLLVSQWHGQTGSPKEIGWVNFVLPCTYGYRSALQPLPSRAFWPSCSAVFGALRTTQAEIDAGDCPYNRHLDGGTMGNLNGSEPYTSCPRNSRTACTARIGDSLSYLGFDTVLDSYPNGRLYSLVRGNENNLKRPLRRVYGGQYVEDLDLLAYAVDVNTNHPDKGWVLCLFAICEGRVSYLSEFAINNVLVGWEHQTNRTGEKRQSKTFFSPGVGNYSGTALVVGRIQGDFRNSTGSDLRGRVYCGGSNDVKVYSDPETYVETFTTNRAWVFYDAWTNERWGHGQSRNMPIQDLIDLAEWCDESVTTLDAAGSPLTSTRSTFVGQLLDKTAQKHIYELCLAGHFTLPFPHRGQTRIMGLSKWENLTLCPVFSDRGENRNICLEDEGDEKSFSSLTASQHDARELPFRIVCTFNDGSIGNQERPLVFEDVDAKLKAIAAGADPNSSKKYSLLGVSELGQAIRVGNLLLDLGPFDGTTDEGGGRKNNFRIEFTTWFSYTLDLHKYKVIKVESDLLEGYGFDYFRIAKMERTDDLHVKITAQAYPKDYYDEIESETPPVTWTPGSPITPNPGGGGNDLPYPIGFSGVTYDNDRIYFNLEY